MATAQQALAKLSKPALPSTPEVKAAGEGAIIAPAPTTGSMPELSEDQYNAAKASATGTTNSGDKVSQLIAKAKTYLGTPYVWGASSPLGFDCSGFVQYVFKQFGVNLPRISYQQATAGPRVAIKDLQPGDLVAWDNSSRNNGADHISIYIGDGKIIAAPKPGDHVKIESLYDTAHAWGVRIAL